jgi:ribosome-associated translation inhibitor RaiA
MKIRQPVEVAVVHGEVPESVLDLAREKVGAVLRLAPAPVLFARVTLAHETAPDIQSPAVAKAVLDVNGRPVRAHVAAGSFDEAVDLLEAKLRHGLEILAEKRQAIRHEPARPVDGNWRHGMLPTARPDWFPRPVEERELVRRKTYLLHEQTVSEAAEDIELLDQDWVLFTEQTTETDALLERTGKGYRLTLAAEVTPASVDLGEPVEVRAGVPRMELDVALALLDELDTPWVFFIDRDTGRGRVVYRRYDGHYGSLTRADQPLEPPSGTVRSTS